MTAQDSQATRLHNVLRQTVKRGRVLTSPAQLAGYDADGLGYKTFRPDAVVIPSDADEMVQILQNARQIGVPICLRGAGTSLSGGPVAAQGGVIVHTSALRSVRKVCPEGFWCEVECGVTLNQLDETLKPYGVFYPPDPSSGPVCTLGGNVAMNAGGAHCFRYGVTSNYVLGVETVLLDGSVHRFGGPAGGRGPWREDWKRFMVGSEGTLGAFTRFWLRVLPLPEKVWTFRATYPDLITAERAIHALVAHSSYPVAIELMDPRCVAMVENSPMAVGLPKDSFMLLTEIDGPEVLVSARVESVAEILRTAGSGDVVFSDDEDQRKKLWKARKAAGGLMGQLSADFVVQDAVIPKRALAELLQLVYDEADAAGIRAVNVFHAGDGNLHPNFLFDSRKPGELETIEQIGKRLMQRVVDVGGTLSGEHGIGNDKAAYMPLVFGPETRRLQMAVPAVFNPKHQLNPLKVFVERRFGIAGSGQRAAGSEDVGSVGRGSGEGNGSVRPVVTDSESTKSSDSRCFAPFLDPIDGVICLPADATESQVDARVRSHHLRFPLVIDRSATLREQVEATGFCPASSRFGPYCDNILGMNWRLSNGNTVRIGERVAKTTTGYDVFRFLVSSGGRFGQPIDYVLRLRPDCGVTTVYWLSGQAGQIEKSVPVLLANCWMHWFDSIDLVNDGHGSHRLRIVMNCPANECAVADSFLSAFSKSHSLGVAIDRDVPAPTDGLPDFVLKTSPERVVKLARDVSQTHPLRTVTLCYPGVIHGYVDEDAKTEIIETVIRERAEELQQAGGDWHSRHIPDLSPTELEDRWISIFIQEAILL